MARLQQQPDLRRLCDANLIQPEQEARERLRRFRCPIDGMPWGEFALRCTWVVIQFFAAYCLANQVSPFFYQRF
jgi:hypothetical protein